MCSVNSSLKKFHDIMPKITIQPWILNQHGLFKLLFTIIPVVVYCAPG